MASVAVSFPHNLSLSKTAIPIFSVPRFPWIELEPAIKSSGFVTTFLSFSEDIYWDESLEDDSETEDSSCSLRALALSPPRVAVPSHKSPDKVLKNSPTVVLEK